MELIRLVVLVLASVYIKKHTTNCIQEEQDVRKVYNEQLLSSYY